MKWVEHMQVVHVVSEPGDVTKYQYIIAQDYDDFYIAPFNTAVRYPQKLAIWEAKAVVESLNGKLHFNSDNETITKLAESQHCNPYTLAEVCRSIVEIVEAKK